MTKQVINVGTTANDRSGDSLRSAFQKINSNFTELYVALGLDSGGLNLGTFEFSGSTISTSDSSSITIEQALILSSNLDVGGDILPNIANGGNLGSATKPWRSLYVSGSTIYIGGNALSINDQGELTYNDNRVAHEAGEFMTLDNLSDLNVNSPNAGDTIAWSGSQYVNVPLTQDRLADDGDEVVLVGGANPYVTFPAITGGDQLIIQGAEVSSVSGSLALTSQDNLNIIANGSGAAPGGSKNWTFSADGSLTIPGDIRSEQEINIDINLGDSTLRRWTFGEDGVLNAPASSGLYNANLFDIRSESNYTAWVRTSGQTGLASINSTGVANVAKVEAISTQPAHVDITVESSGQGSKVWSFGFDGSITFPVGNSYLKENAYDFSINTLSYDDETTLSWTFDRSGHFNVPLSIEFFNSAVGVNAIGTMYGQSEGMVIAGYIGRNLQIATNDGTSQWTFGTDGSLTLPGNLQSNGNINFEINLADSTKRIWQFGEDGDFTIPGNLIYGGDTIHAKESTSTAGNPLTVRAGDSETQVGGNLILRGGDTIGSVGTPRNSGWAVLRAGSTVTGNGGYAELLGGNTTAGTGGQAYVTAGSTTTGNGGPVEITAGDTVTGDGGSVTIESGEAVTGTAGNINITAKGTVTGDGGNVNLTGGSVTSGNGGAINLTAGDTIGSGDPGTIRLRTFNAAATQDWTFNFNGTLTFPDTTVQSTAWTKSAAAVQSSAPGNPVTGQLWYDTDDGNTYIWTGSAWVDSNPAAAAPTVDITDTNGLTTTYYPTFVESRTSGQYVRADVDLTYRTDTNTLTAGNLTTGILRIEDGAHEKFQTKADATGVVAHDCSSGHVFYHTSPDANWTVNLTNLNLSSGYATAVTLIIVQGGTGYYPSAVQIGGVGQTLNWQGNTTPTPSTNRTDVVTFSIINNSGTYTVLGQLTGF